MSRYLPLGIFALIIAAAIWGLIIREDRDALPSALIAAPAPEFDLPSLFGDERVTHLTALAGDEPIIVNFWASWCGPCRVEHDDLMRLKEQGVRIVGIAYKDKPEASQRFLRELGNPFAEVGQDAGRAAINYGLAGVPESFVIAADGTIRYKHVGPINPGELEGKILPALERARGR